MNEVLFRADRLHVAHVRGIVDRYWNEMLPFFLVPVAFVLILASFVLRVAMPEAVLPDFGLFVGVFITILMVLGGRAFIVTRNVALDEEVRQPLGRDVEVFCGRSWCLAMSKP